MNRAVFASALVFTVVFSVAVSHADDYWRILEKRTEQIDRDRINFSWDSQERIASECFAAIAYSPKTGKYGYSYAKRSQSAAYKSALSYCTEADAKVVGWAKNCYCALAESAEGYGFGYADTANEARQRALKDCPQKSSAPKVVICVFSGR